MVFCIVAVNGMNSDKRRVTVHTVLCIHCKVRKKMIQV